MRRAWVDIDLGALLRNAAALTAHAGVPLLPMVKADAYGLGAVRVARTLERLKPWGYGVGTIPEGQELRDAGIARPILIFSPLLEGDFDMALRSSLTPTFGDARMIHLWRATGRPWQLGIDTGMNRAGVQWNEVGTLRDALIENPPEGAFTHFHSAERTDGSRELQDQRFAEALAALPTRPALVHAENGPASEHGGPSRWSMVRPGLFLYGVGSGHSAQIVPEPVVSMHARIIDLRTVQSGESVSYDATYRAEGPRRIATLAVGYADGYRRAFGNQASVLVRGRRARVAGMVTMDMTMIDVTNLQCEIGDMATLMGADGDDRVDADELAQVSGLSPYEIFTGLRSRLPRRYTGDDA